MREGQSAVKVSRKVPPILVPGVEGVRLIASLGVIFIHAALVAEPMRGGGPAGGWLARTSYLAVDVLFVVSGFVQFLPLAAAGADGLPPWRSYAIRRVARIVPAYWLACVITALYVGRFSWGLGEPGKSVGAVQFLVHLLFLNHIVFGIVGRNGFGPNSAMWTMTSEALFYVCLPFVARRFLRHPGRGILCALGIAIGWRALAILLGGWSAPSTNFISQAPAFTGHFAVGMLAAMLVVHFKRQPVRFERWLALGLLLWAGVAIAAWMRAVDPVHYHFSQSFLVMTRWILNLGFAVPVGLLLLALPFAPRWSVLPLANPVARWLGEGTYGTYLLHTLVVVSVGSWLHDHGFRPLGLWEVGGAVAIESLLIGRLSFLLVEEPVRRWAKTVAARRERVASRRRPRISSSDGHLPERPSTVPVVAAERY